MNPFRTNIERMAGSAKEKKTAGGVFSSAGDRDRVASTDHDTEGRVIGRSVGLFSSCFAQ